MKKLFIHLLPLLVLFYSCDAFHDVVKVINEDSPLTEQEVIKGLKEALRVSTDTAVANVSALNGYYKNSLIRISLPPEANVIVSHKDNPLLQAAGITNLINDVELKLNRAAEDAAKTAKPIFVNAITSMSIQDAFDILNGGDTAVTHYFRKKTYNQLKSSFKPKIKKSLDKPLVGGISANKGWSSLTNAYNNVATFTGWKKVNTQLDDYVTRKALDGLFVKLKEEEKQIRKDPASRVTAILERVFGNKTFQ